MQSQIMSSKRIPIKTLCFQICLRNSSSMFYACLGHLHFEVLIKFEFVFICNVDADANISALFHLPTMPMLFKN